MSAGVHGDDLEADLGSLTDEDWREGHLRLSDAGIPDEELEHVWDPGQNGNQPVPVREPVRG